MSKQVIIIHESKLGIFQYKLPVTLALEVLHGVMRARRAGEKQPPLGKLQAQSKTKGES